MAMKLLFGVVLALFLVVSGSSTSQVPDNEGIGNEFLGVLTPPNGTTATEKSYETCTSAACIIQAESLRHTMNPTADPCEDFYEYACGESTAFRNSYIPSGNIYLDMSRLRDSVFKLNARNLLEEKIESTDIRPIRSAKMFYTSCLRAETRKSSPALRVVKKILDRYGAWPMASDQPDSAQEGWQDNNNNFIHDYGIDALFSISLTRRSDNEPSIVISQPSTILDDFQVNRSIRLKRYERKIAGAAKFVVNSGRQNVSKQQIEQDARNIVELEKKIFEITTHSSKASNLSNISVKELQRKYNRNRGQYTVGSIYTYKIGNQGRDHSKIEWLKTIQKCFEGTGIKVDENTPIMITKKFLKYLRKLPKLLDETNPRTIVNYVYWRMIRGVREKVYPYVNKRGTSARWHYCVSRHPMITAISYALATKNHVSEEVKGATHDLLTSVQKQVVQQISDSEWMDESTKRAATNKLLTMKKYIGFKDLYTTEEAVTSYYEGLDLTEDYEQNILIWIKWKWLKDLSRTTRSISSEKLTYLNALNAFYRPSTNSMYIPARIMKSSLIGPGVPESISLGTLGAVIGHEISHAFDREGIKYDGNGNHVDLPRDVKETYDEKSQCFVDQYNSYAIPELSSRKPVHVNGSANFSENIADAAGLSVSFAVLSEIMKHKHFKDPQLPGLENLNAKQLFFVSYGNLWCAQMANSKLVRFNAKDVHTTRHMRVNSAVSNTVGFGEAFNCPVGSRMNPKKKCNIWN